MAYGHTSKPFPEGQKTTRRANLKPIGGHLKSENLALKNMQDADVWDVYKRGALSNPQFRNIGARSAENELKWRNLL